MQENLYMGETKDNLSMVKLMVELIWTKVSMQKDICENGPEK